MEHPLFAIRWHGDNVEEMEAFAGNAYFSFTVGSDADNWKWYHKLYSDIEWRISWLPEWNPPIDKTLLEIYYLVGDHYWTVLRPGDYIDKNGKITRGSNMDTPV